MLRILQPTVPYYRINFFSRLSRIYGKDFKVYASPGRLAGISGYETEQPWFSPLGNFQKVLPGFQWQSGIFSIQASKRDLFIICGAPRNLAILCLLIRCRMKGISVIWWGHFRSATSSWLGTWIRLRMMRLASGILFYTDDEVEKYQRLAPKSTHRRKIPVAALSNGINVDPIIKVRKKYDALERSERLLFIGRLDKLERLSIVLRALAVEENRSVYLEVVGEGASRNRLDAIAKGLGISNRVTWHSSLTEESMIAKVANRCAGFVYGDAVGLSLIHAMAYGLPCIVHDDQKRHNPEIAAFQEGITGFFFVKENDSSLVAAIKRFFSDRERLNRMSANCLEITAKRHNTSVMAQRFESFLLNHFAYESDSV